MREKWQEKNHEVPVQLEIFYFPLTLGVNRREGN